MTRYDEEHLTKLLGTLPPAPASWVQAAQEIPRTQRELEGIVSRMEADEPFRRAVMADIEAALSGAGYTAEPDLVAALRRRLTL